MNLKIFLTLFIIFTLTSVISANQIQRFHCEQRNITLTILTAFFTNYRHSFCIFKNVRLNQPDWQPLHPEPHVILGIEFESSVIPILNNKICMVFPSLENLVMEGVGIQAVTENAFNGCNSLSALSLGNNHIQKILPATFAPLTNLQLLGLSMNELTEFLPELLKENQKLETLELYSNDLEDLDVEQLMRSLPKLRHLNWGDNKVSCHRFKKANKLLKTRRISLGDAFRSKERNYPVKKVGKQSCKADLSKKDTKKYYLTKNSVGSSESDSNSGSGED